MKLNWIETPYGFSEAKLYGYTITNDVNGDYHPIGITIDFYGDIVSCDSEEDAIRKIELEIARRLTHEIEKLNKENLFDLKVQIYKHEFYIIDNFEMFCTWFADTFIKIEKIVKITFSNEDATLEGKARGAYKIIL